MVNNQDSIQLKFFNPQVIPPISENEVIFNGAVTDWVDIHMEKDFFTPSDGCTIVIEDDRALQYVKAMQRGNRCNIYLNGNLNMSGYVIDVDFEYASDGRGTKITLTCKDLLDYMDQGSIYPNFGTGDLTSFHFPPTTTLRQVCDVIVTSFNATRIAMGYPQIKVVVSDNGAAGDTRGNLTLATGFAAGIRVSGKKPAQFTKSFNAAMNHMNTPEKGESYLRMMSRLVKLSGAYIKMAPGSNDTIVVQAPTYDRDVASPFTIYHYLSAPNNKNNNVISAKLKFSSDHQPSVVIVEGNSMNVETFYLTDEKAVAINEMTGYPLVNANDYQNGNGNLSPYPVVATAIADLTTANPTQGTTSGNGYQLLPFNKQLYAQRLNMAINLNTGVSMPKYEVSSTARDTQQLAFEASQMLAEYQDKYIEFTYEMKGWSQPVGSSGQSAVWQPNMLVNVVEESLSPGNPQSVLMWIKKVNYVKDRHNGARVHITCSLPYTHNLELAEPIQPTVSNSQIIQINKNNIAAVRTAFLNQVDYHEQVTPAVEQNPDL